MGSFLTSKKASATLIFLVISILIVSSGVIITNQIKKSNEDNAARTGLVLLDTKQDTSQYLDSSNDEIKFIFGDSEGKISSKKSSGGGGGSSKDSQIYNEPEVSDNDEIIDNQTSENQTSLGYNETFENQTSLGYNETSENQTETNYTEEINVEILSDGQVFEQNGTTYIVRDGAAYILSASSSIYYIKFDPPLPSSVCENEKIDITVKGYGSYSLASTEVGDCAFDGYLVIGWCVKLMEDDLFGAELVRQKCDVSKAYVSIDYPLCNRFYFEAVFSNVDLSDWIIPDPGGNGEFYAKLEGYANDGVVRYMSTSTYNVYAYVNDECDCLSGVCCNLSSRPYEYKSNGSQPTGYTDEYYCSGVNSPTETNYCMKRDYYCNGNSSSTKYTNSTVDTCGTCEYCTAGDPTCNYYSSSTSCGTKDCDYLDTTCRNYYDVNKYCDGAGSCSLAAACINFTNMPKHTSCGTGKECNGSGTCIICTSHSYTGCSDDDVYWYDTCDNKEEKKLPDCGDDSCSDWYRDTCHGDDAYETQLCTYRGCSDQKCYSNTHTYEKFVETCQYGCINGNCKPNPIECKQDSDCPGDHYVGGAFCCFEGHVCRLYRNYFCAQNPETSYCTYIEQDKIVEHCSDYCEDWGSNYCNLDDVYHNKTCHDKGCSDGACFENNTYIEEEQVQECGAGGCSDGECLYVECYEDGKCGNNSYIGNSFCQVNEVWQNYTTYLCNNPGTGNSYCSNSTAPNLKENCGSDYCEGWQSNYCYNDDLYHNKTCHDKGCSSGVCFDNTSTEEEKVQECGTSEYTGSNYCYDNDVYRDYITRDCFNSGCTSSTSKKKMEDCAYGCISGRCKIEVCNYGKCYYV